MGKGGLSNVPGYYVMEAKNIGEMLEGLQMMKKEYLFSPLDAGGKIRIKQCS
jgi:hypothetical protein